MTIIAIHFDLTLDTGQQSQSLIGMLVIMDAKLFSDSPSLQEATTVVTCGEGWSATETLGCLLPLPDPVASLQVPFIASTST